MRYCPPLIASRMPNHWLTSLLFSAMTITAQHSFAEISVQNGSFTGSSPWNDSQASEFMEDDTPNIPATSVEVRRREASPNNVTVLNNSMLAKRYPTSNYTTSIPSPRSTTSYTSAVPANQTSYSYNNYMAEPSVNARSAIVMDAQTGQVLYSKNITTTRPIASITKLMTAVVTADARLNMSERITLQPIDFAGAGGKNSSSTLRVGDEMNRAELLLAALMKSENPAAAALARTYPGGRGAFVSAMNAKARQLGMNSTRYVEASGLDANNVSSARDLAILVSTASQYGLIRQFSTTPNYDFNLGYRMLRSNNTNALVREGGWNINLSKTGYINDSGRCVVMHATVNQRPVAIVLLNATTSQARTNDATNLLNWLSAGGATRTL